MNGSPVGWRSASEDLSRLIVDFDADRLDCRCGYKFRKLPSNSVITI